MLPLLRCFFAHFLILQYPDHYQNLISSSLYYSGPIHKISSQSVHNFLSNVVHRQTDRQTDRQTNKLTNATKNITSFAKEVININITLRWWASTSHLLHRDIMRFDMCDAFSCIWRHWLNLGQINTRTLCNISTELKLKQKWALCNVAPTYLLCRYAFGSFACHGKSIYSNSSAPIKFYGCQPTQHALLL